LQHKVPYTSQKNGVAKRKNKREEMASWMMHKRSLPQKFCAEALNCANYIQKRSPHSSIKDQTPFEAWSNNKLEFTHFCIFGSRAWARIRSEKRKSIDPQCIACIFVGYPEGVKGYKLIDPPTDQLIIERSVQFDLSLSHTPQEPQADTLVFPPIRDDEFAHSYSTSNLSSDTESEDSEHSYARLENSDAQSELSDADSVHADEEPKRMPKWAQSTLQDA
jgi:hypothetical protein